MLLMVFRISEDFIRHRYLKQKQKENILFFDTTEASPSSYRHLVPLRLRMCARTLRLLLEKKHLLADASS